MVVFMDQLSSHTPPMKQNIPVIGQVEYNAWFRTDQFINQDFI